MKKLSSLPLMTLFIVLSAGSCSKNKPIIVEIIGPTDISLTSAVCGGYLINEGGNSITSLGICYSLSTEPTINDHVAESSMSVNKGAFKCEITDLIADTIYYIRSYAITSAGTTYSLDQVSFRTEYTVGGPGPASGIVFYLDGNGNGMEVSPFDLIPSNWGCIGTSIPASLETGFGFGEANTAAILGSCPQPDCAARICADFIYQGFEDWYLPSKDELNEIYTTLGKNDEPTLAFFPYWSSSSYDSDRAWYQIFSDGKQVHYLKSNTAIKVRPVRSFIF